VGSGNEGVPARRITSLVELVTALEEKDCVTH
jgi:hypothetical protein